MSPDLIAKLLALPSLREQAEAILLERRKVSATLLRKHGKFNFAELMEDEEDRAAALEAEMELLADPTRWQSQAWAGKVIAESLGYARDIARVYLKTYPNGGTAWFLAIRDYEYNFRGAHIWSAAFKGFPVDSLPEVDTDETRPAAIAAILLHLSESR